MIKVVKSSKSTTSTTKTTTLSPFLIIIPILIIFLFLNKCSSDYKSDVQYKNGFKFIEKEMKKGQEIYIDFGEPLGSKKIKWVGTGDIDLDLEVTSPITGLSGKPFTKAFRGQSEKDTGVYVIIHNADGKITLTFK